MVKMAPNVFVVFIVSLCISPDVVLSIPSTWDEISGPWSSYHPPPPTQQPQQPTTTTSQPISSVQPEEESNFEAAFQGECQTRNPCHQLCFDLHDGTFECACRDNYFLSDNGYSCIPIDASQEDHDTQFVGDDHLQEHDHEMDDDDVDPNQHNHHEDDIPPSHHNHRPHDFQTFDTEDPEPQVIDSNESVDLEQFSSSNSQHKGYALDKNQPSVKWLDAGSKTRDLQDDGNVPSPEVGMKKQKDEDDFRKYNRPTHDFKSCLEIECEAGGTCVTEQMTLPSRSSRLDSQVYDSLLTSATGEESTVASSSFLHLTSKYNKDGHVRCRCPLGRKGFFCEKPSEVRFPRFRGSSYLALPTLKNSEKSMQLTLEFRPEHYEGLLLYSGEKQTLEGDFIALLLNQGFVEFRFDCGMGEGVVRSERPVLLNSWNRVTVYRDGWTSWLTLNGGQQISGQSQGLFTQINFELELFLGGSPNLTLVSQRTNSFTGFTGCTRKLEINGRSYDFRSDNRGDAIDGVDIEECGADVCSHTSCLNGGQCVAQSPEKGICLCPLGFNGVNCENESAFTVPSFNGSSYLQFPGLAESSGLYLEMQVVFKPRALNGVILYNGQRVDGGGDFVSLNLVDGFVEFRFNPGNGPAIIRSLAPIELSEWHTIYASRTAMMGALQVDDQAEVGGFSAGAFTQLSLPLNLFVGGVADMKDVSRDAGVSLSFSGCVQKVVLNGRTLNMKDEALSGVNIADCPHPCTSEPCQRGGKCEPVLDSYSCHCPLGLVGENCERDVEEITIPMFYGNSYLLFTDDDIMKRVMGSKMDVHLRFRAFAPEGLILWTGDENRTTTSTDFMMVTLDQGLIRYTFNLGSGEVTLLNNYTRVDDGVWHSLRLTRFKREATLRLDSWPVITGSSPGSHIQLNVMNSLFLGGVENPSSNGTRSKQRKNGIIGCISHMTLSQDYHVKLITQATREVNIRTCI